MPPPIDVLTSSSAPACPTELMALKSPLPSPNVMVPKQSFENQETCIAERCVFHDALPIVAYLRGRVSMKYRNFVKGPLMDVVDRPDRLEHRRMLEIAWNEISLIHHVR